MEMISDENHYLLTLIFLKLFALPFQGCQ